MVVDAMQPAPGAQLERVQTWDRAVHGYWSVAGD
jgi:hypothetical protein